MVDRKTITTKKGEATYYSMDDVYPHMITFFVKFKGEDIENEFSVLVDVCVRTRPSDLVRIYADGYQQGRVQGRWEKARRLRNLFDELKAEAI